MDAGQMGETTIEVFMFGGFQVMQDGKTISMGSNPTANALKMIEIIFLNNSQGISKEELLRDVFNGKNLSDKNNSFNNLLYQARHLLRDAGVEGSHYIENRRGKISVENGINISTDVDRFNFLCGRAEMAGEEEKYRFYREAFDLYRWELLPDFMTENWVLQERERLTAELARCVFYLTETERKRGNYDEVIRLYHRANEVFPDSRWQAGELEAWGGKGDYAGASAFFRETARYYMNELQIPVPKNIRQVEEKLIAGEHSGMSPQDEMLLRRSAKLAGSGHKSMMARTPARKAASAQCGKCSSGISSAEDTSCIF
jgi:DNA-binding SARP family transcriptional activator